MFQCRTNLCENTHLFESKTKLCKNTQDCFRVDQYCVKIHNIDPVQNYDVSQDTTQFYKWCKRTHKITQNCKFYICFFANSQINANSSTLSLIFPKIVSEKFMKEC